MTQGESNYLTDRSCLSVIKLRILLQNLICNSLLVNHLISNWNHILSEVNGWYEILKDLPRLGASQL